MKLKSLRQVNRDDEKKRISNLSNQYNQIEYSLGIHVFVPLVNPCVITFSAHHNRERVSWRHLHSLRTPPAHHLNKYSKCTRNFTRVYSVKHQEPWSRSHCLARFYRISANMSARRPHGQSSNTSPTPAPAPGASDVSPAVPRYVSRIWI